VAKPDHSTDESKKHGRRESLFFLASLLATLHLTSTASSNETHLGTRRQHTVGSRSVTDVLVVTTTVRVLNGVLSDTSDLGPAVALDPVLMESTSGLEQGLLQTSAASDDTDHGAGSAKDRLLGTRREADASLALLGVVSDHSAVGAGGTSKRGAVTSLVLEVAHDGTFRQVPNGNNVADVERGANTAVHELASVHALSSNEVLLPGLVVDRVAEVNLRQGSTTTRVVDEILDDALNVALLLRVVDSPELGRPLLQSPAGDEDCARTLTGAWEEQIDGIYSWKRREEGKKKG